MSKPALQNLTIVMACCNQSLHLRLCVNYLPSEVPNFSVCALVNARARTSLNFGNLERSKALISGDLAVSAFELHLPFVFFEYEASTHEFVRNIFKTSRTQLN